MEIFPYTPESPELNLRWGQPTGFDPSQLESSVRGGFSGPGGGSFTGYYDSGLVLVIVLTMILLGNF